MNSQNVKKANLIILNNVAEKLDDLCEDLVFLGGSDLPQNFQTNQNKRYTHRQ